MQDAQERELGLLYNESVSRTAGILTRPDDEMVPSQNLPAFPRSALEVLQNLLIMLLLTDLEHRASSLELENLRLKDDLGVVHLLQVACLIRLHVEQFADISSLCNCQLFDNGVLSRQR